jgi:hypothetical protein
MPYLDMGAIPLLSNIPGLSKPFSFSSTWGRQLEHPENFVADWQNSKSNRTSVASTKNQTIISSAQQVANWDWHNNAFSLMPGQVVLASASTVVPATKSSWTNVVDNKGAALVVAKGQRFTVLTNKSEDWKDQYQKWTNARGDKSHMINKLPIAGLVAKIGESGQQMYAGYHFYDVEATESGPILLRFNDDGFNQNQGNQNVQVLVSN